MEHGADINIQKNHGNTPLFIACNKRYIRIVKYLGASFF